MLTALRWGESASRIVKSSAGRDVVERGVRLAAGGDHGLGVRVARDGGDHVAVGQQIPGAAKIPDHRQLGVGEGADHPPGSDVEARYLRRRGHLPQPRRDESRGGTR